MVTNDTHYDLKPDTVQNEDDVPAQNGIESVESSLPGQEIDNLPKAKDKIKYRFQDNNEWQEAEVLGRAGKTTGKYKSWFNIKNTCDDGASSIDMDKVAEWESLDTFSEEANIVMIPAHRHSEKEVVEAKMKELKNWKDFSVYEEVNDRGQQRISSTWVISEKITDHKRVAKVPVYEERMKYKLIHQLQQKAPSKYFCNFWNEGVEMYDNRYKGCFPARKKYRA